jgi:hypothetical protein
MIADPNNAPAIAFSAPSLLGREGGMSICGTGSNGFKRTGGTPYGPYINRYACGHDTVALEGRTGVRATSLTIIVNLFWNFEGDLSINLQL